MQVFAKYFDGKSSARKEVRLETVGHVLRIYERATGNVIDSWPIEYIRLDKKFPGAVVLITHERPDAQLELNHRDDFDRLNLDIKGKRAITRHTLLVVSLVIITGAVGLFFAAGYVLTNLSQFVPQKWEEIFFSTLEENNYGFDICELDATQALALQKFEQRLLGEQTNLARLEIAKNSMQNAFTLPNGRIYLLTGLIHRTESPEELAGVAAHEIAHVERRDVSSQLLARFVLSKVFSDDTTRIPSLLLGAAFSRNSEAAADALAVKRLHNANISVRGLHRFFERLSNHDMPQALNFISTHPLSADRLKKLEAIDESKLKTEPILTDEEWASLWKLEDCNVAK